MADTKTAAAPIPAVDEAAEFRRLIFEAPIAELAEHQGISIDEAVKLRVEQAVAAATEPQVTVRPIEPQGKLIGFASINFGGVAVDDFKIVNGEKGMFVGMPSKPDPTSRTGYRATVRLTDRDMQSRINEAAYGAYTAAVEKLIARAEAVRPAPIKDQMAKAEKAAAKENATRPAPDKGKEARDGR